MSHFTEVKTEIKNLDQLKTALQKMNMNYESDSENIMIENFFGDKTTVDLKVTTGTKYDIGFIRNEDGCYEISADWELLEKMKFDKQGFQEKVMQNYSLVNVTESLEAQGYEISESFVDENGEIQMVAQQW